MSTSRGALDTCNRLAWVLLFCGAALAGGSLLGGCGQELTEQEYVQRADKSFEQGDYRAAIIDYRNALQDNPENLAARSRLGLAYQRDGDAEAAVNQLDRAYEQGAEPELVLLPLINALYHSGRFERLLELGDADGQKLHGDDRARVYAYCTLAAAQLGEAQQADDYLGRARSVNRELAEVRTAEANLEMREGNGQAAEDSLVAALELDAGFAPAWSLQAQLAWMQGELELAERSYSRFVELRPTSIVGRYNRGLVRIELGDLDGAREDAQFLREGAPEHPAGHQLMGLSLWQEDKRQESRSYFEQSLSAGDGFRPPRIYLAAINLDLGNLAQAEHHLERFHAQGAGNAQSYSMLASLRVEQGEQQQARQVLSQAIEQHPQLRETLGPRLAALYLDSGETQRGVKALRQLIEQGQDTPAVRELLGFALARGGDTQAGLAMLEQAAGADPEPRQADIALIVSHLQQQSFDKAIQAAKRLRQKSPNLVAGYSFHAAALLGKGQRDGARQALREGLEQLPGNPTLSMHLSSLELMGNDVAAAKAALEAAQQEQPGEPASAFRLTEIAIAEGNAGAAERWLEQLVEHNADNPRVLMRVADVYQALGEGKRGTKLLEQLLADGHESVELYYRLARSRVAQGQRQDGIDHLRKALAIDEGHTPSRIALVRQLGLAGQIKEAREALAPFIEQSDRAPQALVQEAWLVMREGRLGEAADLYSQVLDQEQRRQWVLEGVKAMLDAGRPEQGVDYLYAWLEEHPEDQVVRHMLASALLSTGRETPAREAYEVLVEQNPRNPLALNNLAWLYRDADPKRALAYAERAHEIAPEKPEFLDTLGVVLLRNGASERAVEHLREAWAQSNGQQPGIGLNLAKALRETGANGEARDLVEKILNKFGRFDGREEAEQLLQQL